MKIYYDYSKDLIVVEGAQDDFPSKSLSATLAGNKVNVWKADLKTRVVGNLIYSEILDADGNGFASAQECVTYLNQQFSKSEINNGPDYLASTRSILYGST